LDGGALCEALANISIVYFSGISLAILREREALLVLMETLRGKGALVAFDSNYRERLWGSRAEAAGWLERCYRHCDLVMVSFADERAVFRDDNPAAGCQRLRDYGIGEVVMTDGMGDIWTCSGGEPQAHPLMRAVQAVDTTGAGDAFNAAYMVARLRGNAIADAVQQGHELAARVVMMPGAIIPRGA
jgi:2-dehydro-3-deoxygluconokinase